MTPKRVPSPPVTTPDVTSVRLSETERLRAALRGVARYWREIEDSGAAAGDLTKPWPVSAHVLRDCAWALGEEDGDGE